MVYCQRGKVRGRDESTLEKSSNSRNLFSNGAEGGRKRCRMKSRFALGDRAIAS